VAWTPAQTARTKADALRVEEVGELNFPHFQAYVDDIVTVSEDEMLDAIRRLARHARLIAEPGGAVAVAAALYRDPIELGITSTAEQPVVAVLSGGNIDPALLTEILQTESYTG
jgi:threonine dehydratase